MAFSRWQTDFEDFKRHDKQAAKRFTSVRQFYDWRAKQMRTQFGVRFSSRNALDLLYYDSGQAFYNVHRRLVDKLERVNLEKIPASMVELPQGLQAVNIRFDCKHEGLTFTSTQQAAQVKKWSTTYVESGDFVHNFILCRPSPKVLEGIFGSMDLPVERCITLALDANVLSQEGVRTLLFAPLFWDNKEMTLADSIGQTLRLFKGVTDDFKKVIGNCLRIGVTIGFLANSNDELIEPDVIGKLKERYRNGNEQMRQQCLKQSRNAGHFGFNVGNDLIFMGEQPFQQRQDSNEGAGRELRWQHIRDGHPHAVRYGPRHSRVKVMWFRPTRVRPDLPFNPS